MIFPGNRRFAFSILDDTDDATLANVRPIYDQLRDLGLSATKTVWPLDCPEGSRLYFAGETLQSEPYLAFVHQLKQDGFELAFHGATMESSYRERTVEALEFFHTEFGEYPRLFCNHGHNRENLYWGADRFRTYAARRAFHLTQEAPRHSYEGSLEESPYFWGDLCRKHVKYVRSFTFRRLNLLEINPEMPYRLPDKPFVNYWFSTSDAPDVHQFNRSMSRARIDRVEAEGGVCIVSTHLGKGFAPDGVVNPDTLEILRDVSQRPGWFAPVSDILDFLLEQRGHDVEPTRYRQALLEYQFLFERLSGRLTFAH